MPFNYEAGAQAIAYYMQTKGLETIDVRELHRLRILDPNVMMCGNDHDEHTANIDNVRGYFFVSLEKAVRDGYVSESGMAWNNWLHTGGIITLLEAPQNIFLDVKQYVDNMIEYHDVGTYDLLSPLNIKLATQTMIDYMRRGNTYSDWEDLTTAKNWDMNLRANVFDKAVNNISVKPDGTQKNYPLIFENENGEYVLTDDATKMKSNWMIKDNVDAMISVEEYDGSSVVKVS